MIIFPSESCEWFTRQIQHKPWTFRPNQSTRSTNPPKLAAKVLHTLLPCIVTRPKRWYLFYHPTPGTRLTQHGCLVSFQDDWPIQVLTRPSTEQFCRCDTTCYRYATYQLHFGALKFARRQPSCISSNSKTFILANQTWLRKTKKNNNSSRSSNCIDR